MTTVTIKCQTEAPYYDLTIYDMEKNEVVVGLGNTDLHADLPSGDYLLFWRLIGASGTTYKITFSGVTAPTKPVERKIHQGEAAAAGSKKFVV